MRKHILRYATWLALVTCVMAWTAARADLKEGLLVHWKFDDGSGAAATDSSGNDHHGTLMGDPQWVQGHLRGALEFDGAGDYVQDENGETYLNGLDAVTVAMWIKSDLTNTDKGFMDSEDPDGGDDQLTIRYDAAGATYGGTNVMKMGLTTTGGEPQLETSEYSQTIEWQHVAMIWSSGEVIRFYIDGVEDTPTGATEAITGTSTDATKLIIGMGCKDDLATGGWDGLVDEVRVYSRALSADEVVELMNWTGGADAGADRKVLAGDTVTLSGSGPVDATSFAWEQIVLGDEPVVTLSDPNSATPTFDAPAAEIGYILIFQLTVVSPSEGTGYDSVTITARAPNEPRIAPGNVRLFRTHLGFELEWDPLTDADDYGVGVKIQEGMYFWFWTDETTYPLLNLTEGQATEIAIMGRNSYGEGTKTEDIPLVPMRNVALPTSLQGTTPPSAYEYVISHYQITDMNNGDVEDDTNDSWDGNAKNEDYWGYQWSSALYMDQVTYFTGDMFGDGGWFTDLRVQYTKDGTTWINVPTQIVPEYDFSDQRAGKQAYARYDLFIPVLRGVGLRVHGTPGGTATFTSISELEVYGDNATARPLVVQGVDVAVPERSTVTLDGSFSFSTRGDVTGHQWEQVSGPTVTIINPTAAIATFDTPSVDADTELGFRLTAGDGTDTDTDEVSITVRNLKTTAVAGADQSLVEGEQTTLNGSGSISTSDSITYLWTQVEGPTGEIQSPNDAVSTFVSPFVYDFSQDCVLQLTVDDGLGNPDSVSTDTVTLTVNDRHGVIIIREAEDYTSTSDNGDIRTWLLVEGDPTYMTTDTAGGQNAEWDTGCELSYGITIPTPGTYTLLLRRYVDDGGTNSCRVGADGNVAINDFDNEGTNDVWVWYGMPGQFITFATAGDHTLDIRRREGGYRIDRFILYAGNPAGVPAQWSTGVGPPEGDWVGPIFCDRTLDTHYEPGTQLQVGLTLDVNMETPAASLVITENIPVGLTVADPGIGVVAGQTITWSLTGAEVDNRDLSYTLDVPGDRTGVVDFQGVITYGSVSNQAVGGQTALYSVPSAPENLRVEALIAAHLDWSARPPEDGIVGYLVYRSTDGGAFELLTAAPVAGTSYVDNSVQEGSVYEYKVTSVLATGVETELGAAPASDPVHISMEIREAEHFNYGGGLWPWNTGVTVAAEEATAADDLAAGNDYWHPNTDGPGDRSYRPLDNTSQGLGIETVAEADNAAVLHTNIGWIDPGSWYRYTFDVPEPGAGDPEGGWVKFTFRVSAPNGGTLAAYWDEGLVGTDSFVTGNWHLFTYVTLEEQVQTTPGAHTLRLELVSGEMNLDKIGLGFNWTKPTREDIFADDFESYTNLYGFDDLVAAGYTVNNGSGAADGAWRLWNTAGNLLGNEEPAIESMTGNYVITDSDMAGSVDVDEELITPMIDCTLHKNVGLNFNKNYRVYTEDLGHSQTAEVDIRSSDDGVTWGDWANLFHWDRTTVTEYATGLEQVDISGHADRKFIQVRWRFYNANYDYWFAVDDIKVAGDRLPPPTGKVISMGYVAGQAQLGWNEFGGGNYTVEYTVDLTSGSWQSVPATTWPITQLTWSGDISGIFGEGVYLRVRSE